MSLSEGRADEDEAQEWLQSIIEAAEAGLSPSLATMKLAEYGDANMELALRGLELKTLDPYLADWRIRVVPALGHLAVRVITNGAVDLTVQNWIADEHSRSTVKNTIAVLVRVMEQAVRDGSAGRHHQGEPGPGDRLAEALQAGRGRTPRPARPRGGRISTAVLRDATHWDDMVTKLGDEHLRRHDLRHTALTWFADAGVPVHVLRRIAGHGSLTTTQRYLHPDVRKITAAGAALSADFSALRAPRSLSGPIVMTR
ncbi:tyrosine-type recombinase/integrase [Streptomyces sp. NBC_01420]|uniref:tyrosine-type recombinase/integrase n=1 Tax=Streptomyces sp. NBC_01420 TaxID=2903858 RepID=UPI0032501DA9